MGSERLAMGYGRRELITWRTLPHPVQFWVRTSAGDELEMETYKENAILSIKVKIQEMTRGGYMRGSVSALRASLRLLFLRVE